MGNIASSIRTLLDSNSFLRKKTVRRLEPYFSGDVLEVGVGQGPDTDLFKAMPGVRQYVGCDRAEFYSTYTLGRAARPDIVLYEGNTLPFKDGDFDTVVSIDCLEHMFYPDIKEFLLQAQRVLRPGGRLIILAPFIYPEHCAPEDYFRYTSFGLAHLGTLNGYVVEQQLSNSSNIESFFVMALHNVFFRWLPPKFGNAFGIVEPQSRTLTTVKTVLMPFSVATYGVLLSLFHVASLLTFKRETADFSIGYAVVLKKPS